MPEEMTQVRSAEVESAAEEITGTVEGAYTVLLERRDTALAAATRPLDEEEQLLRRESREIFAATRSLELLLPAKARVAQSEADRLLLDGKNVEAAAKLAAAEEARNVPAVMTARQGEISARLEAIEAEKQDIARRVFEQWFPELRAVLVDQQRSICKTLDDAWTDIEKFGKEKGIQVRDSYRSDLTARESGPEKPLFIKLRDWFGGRR